MSQQQTYNEQYNSNWDLNDDININGCRCVVFENILVFFVYCQFCWDAFEIHVNNMKWVINKSFGSLE